ncbi:unnamed protein product [Acanthosepion pharaonis]|uniref:Uncharacterized protein n=1 Tax=Acanthosepion pharaonis TaxID=158019 RepID=A0A812DVZ5_ACAPH|nr:unnamed protein product [Sepia pharaonis]
MPPLLVELLTIALKRNFTNFSLYFKFIRVSFFPFIVYISFFTLSLSSFHSLQPSVRTSSRTRYYSPLFFFFFSLFLFLSHSLPFQLLRFVILILRLFVFCLQHRHACLQNFPSFFYRHLTSFSQFFPPSALFKRFFSSNTRLSFTDFTQRPLFSSKRTTFCRPFPLRFPYFLHFIYSWLPRIFPYLFFNLPTIYLFIYSLIYLFIHSASFELLLSL